MPLAPGVRLGPYEIVGAVGAGGMGEVYRARDPRLGRDVAIKVLPAAYSLDADRLHRFEQEARAAAALNHPNILAVFDIGQHDGSPFIVSELLDGETLRSRLQGAQPRGLPGRTAIDFGLQIARGLAAAHEKGIVHRDLKPENIFITSEGRVKILDFGLAKLSHPQLAATVTNVEMPGPHTEPGVVVGTIGYMSPEQVRGQAVDHRGDIFAFGAIAFEMLSGRRAFPGGSSADVMVAIVAETPPTLSDTEANVPASLARIVDRCLEKHPADRFQSTQDLRFAIEGVSAQSEVTAAQGGATPRRAGWMTGAVVASVAVGLLATGILAFGRHRGTGENPRMVRFAMTPPGSVAFSASSNSVGVSPTGDRFAIVALNTAGTPLLWLRSLDSLDAKPLEGTEGARQPFWSPDGRFIGYFAPGGLIKKVSVDGGPPQTVTTAASTGTGATWNRDGVILFSSLVGPLRRVSAAGGGEVTPASSLDPRRPDEVHSFPSFLPDGKRFLYYARSRDPNYNGIYVKTLDVADARLVLRANSSVVYVAPGFLLYARDSVLMAQPFDVDQAVTTQEPFPLAERIDQSPESGLAAFSASDTGVLVYGASPAIALSRLLWFDRAGHQLSQLGEPRSYRNPRLSPDGTRLAVELVDASGNRDIWLMDTARGVPVRFTFDQGRDASPVWSPDGRTIAWQANNGLYLKPSNGEGREERLRGEPWIPDDWSRDGSALLYHPSPPLQIWLRSIGAPSVTEHPVIEGRSITTHARVSPDGRWVAFTNTDSGRFEIYVQNFPTPAGRWQVSTGGGLQPKWRQDGKELYFLALDGRLMAVPVKLGSLVEIGEPQPLFQTRVDVSTGLTWHQYDLTPDGQRFLVNTPEIVTSPATVVLNWLALVKP